MTGKNEANLEGKKAASSYKPSGKPKKIAKTKNQKFPSPSRSAQPMFASAALTIGAALSGE
jgi:hypothetical protein